MSQQHLSLDGILTRPEHPYITVNSTSRRPPGPRGRFLTGNLAAFRQDVLGFLTRSAREYGDIVGFSLSYVRCCLVNDPALIEQVLVRDHERVRKAWDLRWLRVALGDGLLTNEGDAWRRQRRLVQPAFHNDRIRGYGDIMVRKTDQMLARWSDGEVRDVHADLMSLTLEIVAEALFGVDVAPQARSVAHALGDFMRWFEIAFSEGVPLPLWVPTPANRRAVRAIRHFDAVIRDIIRERRTRGAAGEDLLGFLLAATETGTGMTDRQLRDEVITLLLAGHETTALALSWSLLLVGQHPDVDARLSREVESVLGGRLPTAADLARLGYTRQVVQESLRLYPPAWGFGREVVEPIQLGDYTLRRGTQVFLVPWVTHRDPRFFPDPERFSPERWGPDAERQIPKYAYFPFGGGPRYCVGSNFAMMEAVLLLATMLQRFRFTVRANETVELQPAVTLRPRSGIRAEVRRR